MKLKDLFTKKKTVITESTTTTTITTEVNVCTDKNEQKPFEKVAQTRYSHRG